MQGFYAIVLAIHRKSMRDVRYKLKE